MIFRIGYFNISMGIFVTRPWKLEKMRDYVGTVPFAQYAMLSATEQPPYVMMSPWLGM